MKNTIKNNKINHFNFLAVAAVTIFSAITFSACNNKEDEGELNTTVKLSLSVASGTPMVHTCKISTVRAEMHPPCQIPSNWDKSPQVATRIPPLWNFSTNKTAPKKTSLWR